MRGRVRARTLLGLWKPENRRCCNCWEKMELVETDNGAIFRCTNCGQEYGHVSEMYVLGQEMKDAQYAREAVRNYPEFAINSGMKIETAEEVADTVETLFGGNVDPTDYECTVPTKSTLPERYFSTDTLEETNANHRLD